jgi:hypothetical protein
MDSNGPEVADAFLSERCHEGARFVRIIFPPSDIPGEMTMKALTGLSDFSRRAARLYALAFFLGLLPLAATAQGVAIVTDVSGKVAGPGSVTILSEIATDARLKLEPGAKLTTLYMKSGDEYIFSGPSEVQFQAGGPNVISGAKPQKRTNPVGKGSNVTIKPVGVTQAAYVMRSGRTTARIKLLSLSGTKTLEAAPEFRWQEVEPGMKFRFELTDDTGHSLHETETSGTSLKLPASVTLKPGASYTWEVSARTADNRRYVSAGDFSVASADLRAQAAALRPAASAPVSDRVAYAAWLDQMELRDEAHKYWQALSRERPDDEKLKSLAAE